jgi:hypothetical protein
VQEEAAQELVGSECYEPLPVAMRPVSPEECDFARLPFPPKETTKPLWAEVQEYLGLSPGSVADDDIRRILSGLTSLVDGIGSLRTHAGSAHGHGPQSYALLPRHARLAVHAAHTICLFVVETWESKARGSEHGVPLKF